MGGSPASTLSALPTPAAGQPWGQAAALPDLSSALGAPTHSACLQTP